MWKLLKNSVAKGICIVEEQTGIRPISRPEDIVVLDYLMRTGSTPVIVNNVIKYVPREMTDEKTENNPIDGNDRGLHVDKTAKSAPATEKWYVKIWEMIIGIFK